MPNPSERADVSPPCPCDVTKPDGVALHERIARARGTHVSRSLAFRMPTLLPVAPSERTLFRGAKGDTL